MPVTVPTPYYRESFTSFKDRAFTAQLDAQFRYREQPALYQEFCQALKAEWNKLKARTSPKRRRF